MNSRLFLFRTFALFLSVALAAPAPALALRPAGVEESSVKASLEQRFAAGAEEKYHEPGPFFRKLLSLGTPLETSFQAALVRFAQEGRLVDAEGEPLSEKQRLLFLFAAKALDALPAEVSRTLEGLRGWLPQVPAGVKEGDSFAFLRWLLEQRLEAPLTVVQRVSLYQIAEPELRGVDRRALMAASVLDHLGEPPNRPGTKANQLALSYANHLKTRADLNALARSYHDSLRQEDSPSQLGLATAFLRASLGNELPKIIGSGGLAPASFFTYLPVLSNQHFRRWLAAWWVDEFLGRAGSSLTQRLGDRASLVIGYLEKALVEFRPADQITVESRMAERGKIAAGIQLLSEARDRWVGAMPAGEPDPSDSLGALLKELNDQIRYLEETQPAPAAGAEEIAMGTSLTVAREAISGPGIVVIDAGVFPQRTGLEELLARLPAEGRFIVVGAGSAAGLEAHARNPAVTLATGPEDAATAILALQGREKVYVFGGADLTRLLQLYLRDFLIEVSQLDLRLGLKGILLALGVPEEVLRQLNWTSVETALSSLEAA